MTDQPALSSNMAERVEVQLVSHLYQQIKVGLLSSFFCAFIVVLGLYSTSGNNGMLYVWLSFYIIVMLARFLMVFMYFRDKDQEENYHIWSNLSVFGALLGGISWGFLGTFIFPDANLIQQMLIVLMLSGVTAGAVPLSSSVPNAAIAFLVSALLPLIVSIALFKNYIYLLFDFALCIYLAYSILLSLKSYQLVKNAIILQFKNDELLVTLEEAKQNLVITNKKLHQAATHDPLTQVSNRLLFEKNYNDALLRSEKNHKRAALFYIDFDDFKKINDVHGHRVGDQFLVLMTNRLKEYFGTDKNIARLGGDEFTVIFENIDQVDEVTAIARQICELLAAPMILRDAQISSTVSIGIAVYPDDALVADQLLQIADKRMYEAKEQGGNGYRLFRTDVESL